MTGMEDDCVESAVSRLDGTMLSTLEEDDEYLNSDNIDSPPSSSELSSKRLRYQERHEFHRNFSILLHLGNNFMKRQERSWKNTGNRPFACVNIDSFSDLKLNPMSCQGRNLDFSELLWLYVQAWQAGKSLHRSKIFESLRSVDQTLLHKRLWFRKVVDRIRCYSFTGNGHRFCAPASSAPDRWKHDLCFAQCSVGVNGVDDRYLNEQRLALTEVDGLLGEYETLTSLYPSFRAMQRDVGKTLDATVSGRINILYTWRNTVADLNSKVIQVANMLRRVKARPTPSDDKISVLQIVPSISDGEERGGVSLDSFVTARTLYSEFVVKSLKLRGMPKKISRVESLLHCSLLRARRSLQLPSSAGHHTNIQSFFGPEDSSSDEVNCGCYDAEFKAMALPSFFPTFLYLVRVPLNLVHEWLKLRIVQETGLDPDPLSLDELIQDCRDCLEYAVHVKCIYHDNVVSTVNDEKLLEHLLSAEVKNFTENLSEMFEIYLDFFRIWVRHHHAHLYRVTPEFSQSLVSRLESEWKFAKKISRHVLLGEADAAKRFCCVSNEMLQNIEEFVEDYCDANRIHEPNDDANDDELSCSPTISFPQSDASVYQLCRNFKTVLHEIQERSRRALLFAKLLRNDMEITAKYSIRCSQSLLLQKLFETKHAKVFTPNLSPDVVVLCPGDPKLDDDYLKILLNVTCGCDEEVLDSYSGLDGYLILMKCPSTVSKEVGSLWTERIRRLLPDVDTDMALQHLDIDGVYLVVGNSRKLKDQRMALHRLVNEKYISLVDEQCSCHSFIAEHLFEMKKCALKLGNNVAKWLELMQSVLRCETPLCDLDESERTTYRDTLMQAYNFAFEYHRGLSKLMTGALKREFAVVLKRLAHQWIRFVLSVCEPGHCCRPRWANDGLNFLAFSVSPRYSIHLTTAEYKELKDAINKCVVHVIGTPSPTVVVPRIHSWDCNLSCGINDSRKKSSSPGRRTSTASKASERPVRNESISCFLTSLQNARTTEEDSCPYADERPPQERINDECSKLDAQRQNFLFQERLIGHCLEASDVRPPTMLIAFNRTTFRWQLFNKIIGQGKYGRVFTAMNLDSGQLMAVKQVKYERQDHRAIQALVDEIKNIEGITHANLVRYYGVEVHTDELLIFMEYCSEGTLEQACRDGLGEELVRGYTHSLLNAVCELHRRGIVHRDIKPANIFLTSDFSLKLGDFGCTARLKSATNTGLEELTSCIGTAAYMAPEVCAGIAGGYGRACDIWSLGCVVLEMITGKPPWQGYHFFSIIYKVGNGGIPPIPENVSEDGRSFLSKCLVRKMEDRWPAERLIEHQFVKDRVLKLPLEFVHQLNGDGAEN